MNIVEPYARLMRVNPTDPEFTLQNGIDLLRKIEWCARISHRSEDACTPDSWQRIIKAVVMDHGDWSVVEHASVTVDALVDRGITHEWVRHRLFSFTQESTRFCNYGKKNGEITVIQPPDFERNAEWNIAMRQCEAMYLRMLELKQAPQLARSVLPNSLASRLIITGNLRNWRHFFVMRTTREAHPQMRQVTIPLLAEFKEKIPVLFDDIEPMAKQSEGMKKAR